jgi:GT2 family glycosyltransferase
MKVAVIIPTFNRRELLSNLLNILVRQTTTPLTIIVVDASSSDGTKDMLSTSFKEVTHLICSEDLWWTESINVGLKYVRNNFPSLNGVVLLNDDVIIGADWLRRLLDVADNNKKSLVGCVAVDFLNPNKILYAGKHVNTWLGSVKHPYYGEKLSNYDSNKIVKSFDLLGRGIYIPMNVFKEIGLYDEISFKHRGDTELPLRARVQKGYNLIVSFSPIVKIMPNQTAQIDIKNRLTLKEVFSRMNDFRGSFYWKYTFYYIKIYSTTIFQQYFVFLLRMIRIFFGGLVRTIISRK